MADTDTSAVLRLLQQSRELPAIKSALKSEILTARGDIDVAATIKAVADTSPAANLVRNAAHAAAQALPGEVTGAAPPPARAAARNMDSDEPAAADSQQAATKLAAAQERWQQLLMERLKAAQALLPQLALAAEPRRDEELQRLREQVADMEPWERIGSSSSPFTGNMQELAPNISKLLYDWADLLEAITTPISNPEAAPQDGRTGGAGVGSARGQDGAGATNVGGVRQQVQQQQQHQGGSGSSQRGPTSRAGQLQPPAAVPAAAAAARGGAAPPAVGGRRSGYHSGSDGSSSDSGSGSTDEGSGGSSMGGGGRRGKRRAIGSTPRGSLLWAARAPTRAWLQSFFSDLRADNRQVGLDDALHTWFREQSVTQAQRVLASGSAAAARCAARTGLPPSARPAAWACALGLPPQPAAAGISSMVRGGGSGSGGGYDAGGSSGGSGSAGLMSSTAGGGASEKGVAAAGQQLVRAGAAAAGGQSVIERVPAGYAAGLRDEDVLRMLCEGVERQPLLLDALTCADACSVADSEHYFPFANAVRALILAFSRDSSICRSARVPLLPRLVTEGKGGLVRPYPPSSVLPFRGLAAYAAPLAFLYRQPAAAYRVLVAMYSRYWCALHCMSLEGAPAPGMPALCRTVVELLEEVDPAVARHLESIGLPALEVAFPWMFSAFVGYLSPGETLLLWDRIIGFDSLLPLPLMAVAVLTFRRDLILSAASPDELVEVTEDLGQLKVVPLLQALLFDT